MLFVPAARPFRQKFAASRSRTACDIGTAVVRLHEVKPAVLEETSRLKEEIRLRLSLTGPSKPGIDEAEPARTISNRPTLK